MDRKTLEYMSDRVEKARVIVRRIDDLTKQAQRMEDTDRIRFSNSGDYTLMHISCPTHERLVKTIRSTVQGLIADEIATLEKELAEL